MPRMDDCPCAAFRLNKRKGRRLELWTCDGGFLSNGATPVSEKTNYFHIEMPNQGQYWGGGRGVLILSHIDLCILALMGRANLLCIVQI